MPDRKRVFRGDRLKEARLERGFSQEELSTRLGFAQAQLTRYETNKADPSAEVLIRMAKELQVTVDWLLGLAEIPNIPVWPPDFSSQELRLVEAYRRNDLKEIMRISSETSS